MTKRTLSVLTLAALSAMQQLAAAGTTNDLVTISLSGSTAMRNFTTAPGFTYLTPGTSITLNSGPGGSAVVYTAPAGPTTTYQLAPGALGSSDPNDHYGLRVEWHEQGAVEGILELANSQIAPNAAAPTTITSGNRVFVNRNPFSAPGTQGGYVLGQYGAANQQSPVQMAISDVNARQGFARAGVGTFSATATSIGYGQGNGALANGGAGINGLGAAGVRQQLQPESVLNINTTLGGSDPWKTAGVANLDNKVVAVTATVFCANPGTGLTKLNRSDAQWLQTTGRLANGADFNVAERDVNSGTRNVAALNTGVDPSWAVGEHDNGNSLTASQNGVGPTARFSGKQSGSALSTTIRNARMAIGPLGMSDAIGVARDGITGSQSTTPLRGLDYIDADTDAGGSPVRASAASITDGSYVIWQNETYVTAKNPSAAFQNDTANQWAARTDAETGIKGDNAGNDVADIRGNILNAVTNFPATSVANPADELLKQSFILPQMVWKSKTLDGVNTASGKTANVNTSGAGYNATLRGQLLASTYKDNFAIGNPALITKGAAGALYNGATSSGAFTSGTVAITDNGAGGGNWLFGNFNQNGVRDLAAIKTSLAAAKGLFTADNSVDLNAGIANSTPVMGGLTKGDLVVMGDYNADGKFDGKDVYAMAHGAALSDNTSTDRLVTKDYRSGVLRKNSALDYMQTNTADASASSSFLRTSARNDYQIQHGTNANGANSFNKFDVDHSGVIDRNDAAIVDKFIDKDFTSITDQLAATINQGSTAVNSTGELSPASQNQFFSNGNQILFNLVDAKLHDGSSVIDESDFTLLRAQVGAGLLGGDSDFNGVVNGDDFNALASNFGLSRHRWSLGDFTGDGQVNGDDFNELASNFGLSARSAVPTPGEWAALESVVPEPTTATVLVGALGIASMRRRRARRASHR